MAKRKKKRSYRRRKPTIPLSVVAGIVAGSADAIESAMKGDLNDAAQKLVYRYTGYRMSTKKFELEGLKMGLLPLIAGIAGHKIASWLGLNRAIAQTGIPLIRI